MEALERASTLAIKLEKASLTGTAASSGTTVTGTGTAFNTELKVGDVIGTFAKGFRTVTAIASATSLTVDEAFDVALSADTLEYQKYGVNPTVAAADVIEYEKGIGIPTYKPDMKERNVVRNTKSKMSKVRGAELNAAGNISVELHGSGTPGTPPESDPLWLSAIGTRRASTASATHAVTACTTTSIVLVAGNGANHRVGEAIAITLSGTVEVAWITAIATDTLTVSPAFSAAPGLSVAVGAGVHYKLSKREHWSFWETFWRGNITKCQASGNKADKLNMEFKTGEILSAKFSHSAKATLTEVAEAYGLGTPSFDTTLPLVARNMQVKVGGTAYDISDLSFEVSNGQYKKTSLNTSGVSKVCTIDRSVSGSFDLLYEDTTFEAAFRADSTAELAIVAGGTLGNIMASRMPKIRYTEIDTPLDNGLFKYANKFDSEFTSGEDEFYLSFL